MELVGQAPQAASSSTQGARLHTVKLSHVQLSVSSLELQHEVLQHAQQLTALQLVDWGRRVCGSAAGSLECWLHVVCMMCWGGVSGAPSGPRPGLTRALTRRAWERGVREAGLESTCLRVVCMVAVAPALARGVCWGVG